jgi:radical SAM protein with 4Fe4S-binding SPASM domain
MTLNDEWIDIYRQYFNSSIGVSWDPEIRLLRRDAPETNIEFEVKFWENMGHLLKSKIKPYLVVTATKTLFENFPIPYDFFTFMESKGIRRVHLERVTKTGYARESWDRIGLSNREYSEEMSRWARAYQVYLKNPRNRGHKVQMSPFDGLFDSVRRLHRGESGGYGCLSGVCDSRFHTIDANGYKFGCTAINSESDNKNASVKGVQVINTDMLGLKRKVRQADCMNCEFKSICSSGCMATEKMDESMECSGSFNLFKEIDRLMTKEGNFD